jgi:hypothetical protein
MSRGWQKQDHDCPFHQPQHTSSSPTRRHHHFGKTLTQRFYLRVLTNQAAKGASGGGCDGGGKSPSRVACTNRQNPIRHKIIPPFETVCLYLFRFRGVSQPAQATKYSTVTTRHSGLSAHRHVCPADVPLRSHDNPSTATFPGSEAFHRV